MRLNRLIQGARKLLAPAQTSGGFQGARQRYVRDLWTYVGMLIVFMPLPGQIFSLLVLAFVSLSILDAEGDNAS